MLLNLASIPTPSCYIFFQDILNKLKDLHPLPGLILEWRRISNAITKVVFPLQREKHLNPFLRMERIYPVSQSHTATGEEKCMNCPVVKDKLSICDVCLWWPVNSNLHPCETPLHLESPQHPHTKPDPRKSSWRPSERILSLHQRWHRIPYSRLYLTWCPSVTVKPFTCSWVSVDPRLNP